MILFANMNSCHIKVVVLLIASLSNLSGVHLLRNKKTSQAQKCSPNQFLCTKQNMCIPTLQICNGRNDCNDGSDENYCYLNSTHLVNWNEDELYSMKCMLCKKVIEPLENIVKSALEKVLASVCDKLPFGIKYICRKFIEKYGTQIIDYLVNNFNPEKVCSALHLCDSYNTGVMEKIGCLEKDDVHFITITENPSATRRHIGAFLSQQHEPTYIRRAIEERGGRRPEYKFRSGVYI